jgi:transposase-like protein
MGGGLRPSKRESAMEQTMEQSPNSTGSPTPVRRKYSAEFKASVVEQCSQPGYTTAAVAKRHGIHVSLVRRWAQLMRQAAQSNAAQQQAVESWTGASPDAPQTETSTATATSAPTPAQTPVAPVAPTVQCPATAATVPAFIALARGQTTQPAAGQAAPASPCAFDPQATVTPAWNPTPHAPPAPYSEAIHIQLHSGSAQVHIRWPTSAAAQCVQWMREGLAPLWQPAPTNHHLADNLPPDKPPPDGDALPHSSRPASPAARVAR